MDLNCFERGIRFVMNDVNIRNEPRHDISNNVVCGTSKGSNQLAHTRSLIRACASHLNILMIVKLLTEQQF